MSEVEEYRIEHVSPAGLTVGELRARLDGLSSDRLVLAFVPCDPEGLQLSRFPVVGAEPGSVRSASGGREPVLLLDCSYPSGSYAVEPRASVSLAHGGIEPGDAEQLLDDVDEIVDRECGWRGPRRVGLDEEALAIIWTWYGSGASRAAAVALDHLARREVPGWTLTTG